MSNGQKIAMVAQSYLGQLEKKGNSGFKDPIFEKKMRGVGFYTGAAWCGFFAILVWKESSQDTSILSASSKMLVDKATKAKNWHSVPVVGAVAVYAMFKNGKRQSQGHIAVVVNVPSATRYDTVDGNTTEKGGREGIMVAERFRNLNAESWAKDNGLRLMGFVYPD